ncbi:MAG: nitroreductase family protein [Acidimicrobiia bacterium]|nr:nitroreductase family protein [Acidimicrobiia bacterium]MDH5237324.1 nitroreductase family protein [Acidimicrobiia bacterium]
MDFADVIATRRMVRAYRRDPVDPGALERVLHAARRAPAAGNTDALDLVVLAGTEQTAAYWDTTLPEGRRNDFPWPDLLAAPVIVLVVTNPAAYVSRYAEADKAVTGLGRGTDAWPVPFWFVDGGAVAMALLLGAVDEGLGALLFGVFEHEGAVRERFAIPADRRIVAAVAIGHPTEDRPSRSTRRPRRPLTEVVHRGRW